MDDGFAVNFLPPDSDRGSGSMESRSEPNLLESGDTVESSRGCSCGSCDDADKRPDEWSGWTNEKHNSYLRCLEKSFVRQLYCLMGGKTQRSSRTHDLPVNSRKPTDQFSVLQSGCWQKNNFGAKRTHLGMSSDFYFRENPLTSSAAEPRATAVRQNSLRNEETNHSGDKVFTITSLWNPVGHEYSTESTAEASGQNFIDEEKEEIHTHSPLSKRYKRD